LRCYEGQRKWIPCESKACFLSQSQAQLWEDFSVYFAKPAPARMSVGLANGSSGRAIILAGSRGIIVAEGLIYFLKKFESQSKV